jgi:putative transposase
MELNPNEIYHVYNRGNNKQQIFFDVENYYYFLEKAKKYLVPYCDILAFSLMPNHFHFMIHANEKTNLPFRKTTSLPNRKKKPKIKMTIFSRGLQQLLSSYTKGINKRFNRTGSLFQQNTKWKRTSSDAHAEDYSVWCFIYIHNNPKVAGLVNTPEDYEFTSYQDFIGKRTDSICNIQLAKELLSLDENEIFIKKGIEVPPDVLKQIF